VLVSLGTGPSKSNLPGINSSALSQTFHIQQNSRSNQKNTEHWHRKLSSLGEKKAEKKGQKIQVI